MNTSYNGKFLLEPYLSERVLKTTSGSGFAMIQQKVALKPLKLVIGHNGYVGQQLLAFPKGTIAWVREEFLYNDPKAKLIMEAEGIEGKFIILDAQDIVAFGEAE
jgi:hypothetical protein